MFPSYTYAQFPYSCLSSPQFPVPITAPATKYRRTWKKATLETLCHRCEEYAHSWNKPMTNLDLADFAYIAMGMEQTPEQCFAKYREIMVSGSLKAGVWCNTEEDLLVDLVQTTTLKWGDIAKVLNDAIHGGVNVRTGKKCKEQWNNHLNPNVNKGEWLPEEDLAILLGHSKYGNRWSLIAKHVSGRMESSVKNRIKSLLNRAQQFVKQSSKGLTPLALAIESAQEKVVSKTE